MIKFRQKQFINFVPSIKYAINKAKRAVVPLFNNIKTKNAKGVVKTVVNLPKNVGAVPAVAAGVGAATAVPGGLTVGIGTALTGKQILKRIIRAKKQMKNKELVNKYIKKYNKQPTIVPNLYSLKDI